MQFRYVDEKTIMILTEEGLEEWFWEKMYKALVSGDVKFKKVKRKAYDDSNKIHSNYTTIQITREK